MDPRKPLYLLLLTAACAPAYYREDADRQVYGILENAASAVTGTRKTYPVDRPVDNLRRRLIESEDQVRLSLLDALDVAAENSRDYQRQKEQLYLAALNLTRAIHDFELVFGGGGSAEIAGEADRTADVLLTDDLSASYTSPAGTRVVASFVNTFLRSVVNGGAFDGSSILNLTLTQPLLRGAGARIVREPLTQAERDVIYAMRSFERFRSSFALQVVSDYYDVIAQMADLESVEANYRSVRQSREEIEELVRAGRRTINDLGQAQQDEYTADNNRVNARNRLQTSLDRFKFTLGLPVTAQVELDINELQRLKDRGVTPVDLPEETALALALQRRYDYQTSLDEVEDAGRRVLVSEDALQMSLDFSAALNVPAESGSSLNLDWSRVNWAAGFDLDLALDKLVERNAYRSALISLDAAIRGREQAKDAIVADVRSSLRNIQSAYESYEIQLVALELAQTRVEATEALYDAGRNEARDLLEAKRALLNAELNVTDAIVNYAVARLQLLDDLEAIALEPKGLRFDPALPIPSIQSTEPPE